MSVEPTKKTYGLSFWTSLSHSIALFLYTIFSPNKSPRNIDLFFSNPVVFRVRQWNIYSVKKKCIFFFEVEENRIKGFQLMNSRDCSRFSEEENPVDVLFEQHIKKLRKQKKLGHWNFVWFFIDQSIFYPQCYSVFFRTNNWNNKK